MSIADSHDRKDHVCHFRVASDVMRILDEGKRIFGTRSSFIRAAVKTYDWHPHTSHQTPLRKR